MSNDNDLSSTIVAKSDQLNADDLMEPMTITITRVDKNSSDQPVSIHAAGIQPYKPCLTMRRMLISCWGKFKDDWIGHSMTVYCDPAAMWGGKAVGGIRVSHASHIDEPVTKMLAVTRGRKAMFTIMPLIIEVVDYSEIIATYSAASEEEKEKSWPTLDAGQQSAIIEAFKTQGA
jgi:hypothetical protein